MLVFLFAFAGWLFDKLGSYTVSFLFLSVVPLVSLVPMLIKDLYYTNKQRYAILPSKDVSYQSD